MASFHDVVDIANTGKHRAAVKYYTIKAAVAIMAEDAGTESHAERVVYANMVLSGAASVDEYAIAVATNSTVLGKILADQPYDSDLEFVVNSLFNAFAGVST